MYFPVGAFARMHSVFLFFWHDYSTAIHVVSVLLALLHFFKILLSGTLILSTLQTNADAYANSVDPDETARNEPFHQDLH